MKSNYTSKFINFLVLSIIFHLSILIFSLSKEESQEKQEQKKEEQQQNDLIQFEVIYPPETISSTMISEADITDGLNQSANKNCEDNQWYGGIGVKVQVVDESVVLAVFEGYPAERAGILPGDRLISLNDGQIKGDPGTLVMIQINREELVHTVPIIREKICYGN